jgi:hypothetical protein
MVQIVRIDSPILWENPNITEELILKRITPQRISNHRYGGTYALGNISLSWEFIKKHKLLPDNFHLFFDNPKFSLELLNRYPQSYKSWAAQNPNITWEHVVANSDKDWDYHYLSRNPNTTWQIVCDNPDKPWDYVELSANTNIKWDHVCASPNKEWSYFYLSANPNITWDIVRANINKPWDFNYMARHNPNITMDIVRSEKRVDWCYYDLINNPNITMEEIYADQKFSDYLILCGNPNMGISDFKKIYSLCKNLEQIKSFSDKFIKNPLGHHPHFRSSQYRRRITKQRHDQMYSELLARTCRTSRLFSWNEGAAEQMPTEYAEECRRWREMRFTNPH